jgi:uncharacterized membrane protein
MKGAVKMIRKYTRIINYLIFALLAGIAIWLILTENSSFGMGLLVGVIIAVSSSEIRQRRIRAMQEKGLDPYDERVWFITGKSAYFAVRVFTVTCAVIVLVGSVWGPEVEVNPYNLLGLCLCFLLGLYVVTYYYYNNKF